MTTPRVAAVLTSHNRREQTLACLEGLRGQAAGTAQVDVFLLDAASGDGTPDAVAERFPEVTLLRGSSDLYWNGGMRLALAHAVAGNYDYYLWINDDTHLDDGALARLLRTDTALAERGAGPAITVGSTRDPDTGALTYGGVRRRDHGRPLHFTLIPPGTEPVAAETMNGNCVLVPRAVVERVGNLDEVYTHGIGDFDYGLRARRAGCGVFVAPGTVGTCARNPADTPLPMRQELRRLVSPKGLPPREWATFARRWAGPAWPFYALGPYVRLVRRAAMWR